MLKVEPALRADLKRPDCLSPALARPFALKYFVLGLDLTRAAIPRTHRPAERMLVGMLCQVRSLTIRLWHRAVRIVHSELRGLNNESRRMLIRLWIQSDL